ALSFLIHSKMPSSSSRAAGSNVIFMHAVRENAQRPLQTEFYLRLELRAGAAPPQAARLSVGACSYLALPSVPPYLRHPPGAQLAMSIHDQELPLPALLSCLLFYH